MRIQNTKGTVTIELRERLPKLRALNDVSKWKKKKNKTMTKNIKFLERKKRPVPGRMVTIQRDFFLEIPHPLSPLDRTTNKIEFTINFVLRWLQGKGPGIFNYLRKKYRERVDRINRKNRTIVRMIGWYRREYEREALERIHPSPLLDAFDDLHDSLYGGSEERTKERRERKEKMKIEREERIKRYSNDPSSEI